MRRTPALTLLLCVASLLAAGCGDAGNRQPTRPGDDAATRQAGAAEAAAPDNDAGANDHAGATAGNTPAADQAASAGHRQENDELNPGDAQAYAAARRTVAEFLGIDAERVTLVSVTARDFPDASLGCPQPGMAYPQVITPGHEVVVEADGRRFDVRVAGTRGRICHRRRSGGSDPGAPRVPELIGRARTDLAARLALPADQVQVRGVKAWRPGMAVPGCEPPCPPGDSPCGYLLHLAADDRSYLYFASGDALMPCPPIERS